MTDPLPVRRLLAIAGTAAAGAVVAALAAGTPTWLLLRPAPGEDDGFEALGAAFGAALIALAAALIAYVTIVVVGVRRSAPAGARLRPIVSLLLAPIVLYAALGIGAIPGLPGAYGVVHVLPMAALGTVAVIALGWLAGRRRTATTTRLVAVASAVAAVVIGIAIAAYPAAERAELRRHYERAGVRLALVDGTTLEEPFPGWEVSYVTDPRWSDEVVVAWHAEQVGLVTLRFTPSEWTVTAERGGRRNPAVEAALRSRLRPVSIDAFIDAADQAQS